MIWQTPYVFCLIPIIALGSYFAFWEFKRHNAVIHSSFAPEMLKRLVHLPSTRLSYLKGAFFVLGLLAIVCVLAGPHFGLEKITKKTLGRDVFVLLDVSESMLAEDIAPNRLAVAKLDIEDLLDAAIGDRIGLIAFAGSAQVEIPLTTDYVFFRDLLRKLDTTTVNMGGTVLGDAIRLALTRFGKNQERERVILLITDGEDHESLPIDAARNAKESGVPIFTIAIGDINGAPIPIFDVNDRRIGYKKFDGEEVMSKPDVNILKEIANQTGGRYYYADSELNLASVYHSSIDAQQRSLLEEKTRMVLKDRYQPFLVIGIIMFALSYFLPSRLTIKNKRTQFICFYIVLSIALCSTEARGTEEVSKDTSALQAEEYHSHSSEKSFEHRGKKQELQDLSRAFQLMKEGKFEEAYQLQQGLSQAKTSSVSSRANYNLAALDTAKALEKMNQLEVNNRNETADTKTEPSVPSNSDPTVQYMEGRKKRDLIRDEIEVDAQSAIKRFFLASQDNKEANVSQKAMETLARWNGDRIEKNKEDELKIRNESLNNPIDRWNWLWNKLELNIIDLLKLRSAIKDAKYYQTLFNNHRLFENCCDDVEFIVSGAETRLQSSQYQEGIKHKDQIESDNNGLSKIYKAKEDYASYMRLVLNALEQYDVEAGINGLHRARVELLTLNDVPSNYEELVLRLDSQETKRLETIVQTKEVELTKDELERVFWEYEELKRSIDEVIRKARTIIGTDSIDNASQSSNSNAIISSTEEPLEDQEILEEEIQSEPNTTDSKSQQKTREEKIQKSSKIAIDYIEEINSSFDTIKNIGANLQDCNPQKSKEILNAKQRIAQIVQEIAQPLKDNDTSQNQNQDSQKQDQNNKDNKSNKNQKNQNSDSSNDKNKSETSDVQNDSSNPPEPQQQSPNNATDQESEDKEQPPKQDSNNMVNNQENNLTESQQEDNRKKIPLKPEKTEEQKEAEALSRQVIRRQKDAEVQRRALRQALKRREHSGKDW